MIKFGSFIKDKTIIKQKIMFQQILMTSMRLNQENLYAVTQDNSFPNNIEIKTRSQFNLPFET